MTSNHHLPSGIRFFKVILDAALQRGKLKISNMFTRKYGDNLPNPVFLKTPDGIEWEVYLTKQDDGGIWLERGWNEFATYYSLSHGHFLVFTCQETCHFEVLIFAQSSLEIDYNRVNGDGVNHPSKKRPVKDSHEVTPRPEPRKRSRTRSRGVGGQSSNLPQHVQTKVEQSQEDRGGATKSVKVEQATSNVAGTSRSNAPSFSIVMKASYLCGHSVVIPSKFVKKYLKEKRRDDILLQVLDGRTWTVSFRNGRFSTGWNKFVSNNHLNVGDVCAFELTKSRGHCFKVTIIPISEETHSPVQGNGDPGRISDLKCVTDIPIKAMQEAMKFTSGNPFFSLNIRANDNGDFRPRIPVSFMKKYLKNKQVVTLQFGNKLWPVNLIGTIRTKLSKGWSQFANQSKVRAGDICVFELVNRVDTVLHVHIYRDHS